MARPEIKEYHKRYPVSYRDNYCARNYGLAQTGLKPGYTSFYCSIPPKEGFYNYLGRYREDGPATAVTTITSTYYTVLYKLLRDRKVRYHGQT
jgi:hypothetical protein